MKVLVVDDTAANRLVLAALLKRAGHEVFTAADAEGAVRTLESVGPDAVLTDLHLGDGGDGRSLARLLRAHPRGASLRLGLVTGDPTPPAEAEELFDVVLEKPVMLKDLTSFLEGGTR